MWFVESSSFGLLNNFHQVKFFLPSTQLAGRYRVKRGVKNVLWELQFLPYACSMKLPSTCSLKIAINMFFENEWKWVSLVGPSVTRPVLVPLFISPKIATMHSYEECFIHTYKTHPICNNVRIRKWFSTFLIQRKFFLRTSCLIT